MPTLRENLWSVAKEYARQAADVLQVSQAEVYWIGSNRDEGTVDVCAFGDTLFLTLDELQTIIDDLDRWTARYGSREAVGQEVQDWNDWVLEHMPDPTEAAHQRAMHTLRPAINLRSWLAGLHDQPQERPSAQADYIKLKNDHDLLRRLIDIYGENRSLWNVLKQIDSRLEAVAKQKEAEDRAEWQRIMQSPTGQAFRDLLEQELEQENDKDSKD